MPSIAEAPSSLMSTTPISSKKRRRDDASSIPCDVQMKLSPSPGQHAQTFSILNTDGHSSLSIERKLLAPRFRHVPSKRQRLSLPSEHDDSPLLHDIAENKILSRIQGNSEPKKKINTSPCHICRRKPTQKNELDCYSDCEGCGERCCWICFRECVGLGVIQDSSKLDASWETMVVEDGSFGSQEGDARKWEDGRIAGHRQRVCSRCCVERGTDGEVWCLGCLSAEKGD